MRLPSRGDGFVAVKQRAERQGAAGARVRARDEGEDAAIDAQGGFARQRARLRETDGGEVPQDNAGFLPPARQR